MEYPTRSRTAQQPQEPEPSYPSLTLSEWITDICRAKDCRDGFVSFEVQGYDTVFACPACDRHKRLLKGLTAIPTAKKWPGSYATYTDAEITKMIEDRRVVAEGLRRGSGKLPPMDVQSIGWLDK